MNDRAIPIFDGHNDVLLRLHRAEADQSYDFFAENPTGHLDLPRARKGYLVGGIFAIFTPTPQDSPEREPGWGLTITENGYRQILNSALDPEYAIAFTNSTIDLFEQLVAESQGEFRKVTSVAEIERCMESGTVAAVLHFEGAEAVREDLSNLEDYYRRGLRSLGIVWSRPNCFATGVPFRYPDSPDIGPGLTEAGKALVRACNRLGILIDLAHLNQRGFWDVAELTNAPLVVTHSNVHAICASTRNLTDRQIDAVGQTGGVIGINFEPSMVRADGRHEGDIPLADLVRHVGYITNRIGVDHVALGSDFDGAVMPDALCDAAGLQKLISALSDGGFDTESIEKIAYRNWLRVLGTAWKEAA